MDNGTGSRINSGHTAEESSGTLRDSRSSRQMAEKKPSHGENNQIAAAPETMQASSRGM